MIVVHLYLKPGAEGALNVVQHTFAGGAPAVDRVTIPADGIAAWLEAVPAIEGLRAVYCLHAAPAAKPESLACPWIDLPPGHPCENL